MDDLARASLEEHLNISEQIFDSIVVEARLFRYNDKSAPQLAALGLHTTIIELLAGCIALARSSPAGIPILLRSMYEAVIDLTNLLTLADYYHHLDAANLKQLLTIMDQAETNPILDGWIVARPNLPNERAELRAKFEDLQRRGIHPLSMEKRIERAGRGNEYRSLYAQFCLDTHNNLAALADRHMTEDGERTVVSILGDGDLGSLHIRLYHAARISVESAVHTHRAFQTGTPELDGLRSKLKTCGEIVRRVTATPRP